MTIPSDVTLGGAQAKNVTLQTNASLDGRVLAQTLTALDNNAVTAP